VAKGKTIDRLKGTCTVYSYFFPFSIFIQYPNRLRQVRPVPVDERKLALWKTQRNIYLLVVAEFSASVAQRCLSTPESSAVSLR
jgi:hypothetical protein